MVAIDQQFHVPEHIIAGVDEFGPSSVDRSIVLSAGSEHHQRIFGCERWAVFRELLKCGARTASDHGFISIIDSLHER
jgi:hypothetical protein